MRLVFPGGGLFGGGAPSLPPPAPPLPDETDAQIKAKADQARIDAQRRKGLLSTNLTGGLLEEAGGADETTELDRPTLLGV